MPEGVDSPGAGLSQTKPVEKSSQSRFKAVSTSGVSLWCCGCHEGVYERCWRLSEAFQRGVGGLSHSPAWGVGLWTARSLFTMGPRNRGRKRLSRVELLPEPGSESRFGISPEPGASAWWGEISWLPDHPDHPGGPQVFSPGPWNFSPFSPGISAPEFQPRNFSPGISARNFTSGRASALSPVA